MRELPTLAEAIVIGPGPPLKEPDEVVNVLSAVWGYEKAQTVSIAAQLEPFAAWALWFVRWIKGNMSAAFSEVQWLRLVEKLHEGDLPARLEEAWKVWQDESKSNDSLHGFDIIFCDGPRVIWTGMDVFHHIDTLKVTDFLSPAPMEKRALDAIVLFRRCLENMHNNRMSKDASPRNTSEAGPGSPNQGGA